MLNIGDITSPWPPLEGENKISPSRGGLGEEKEEILLILSTTVETLAKI